jgi:hypothetical protein
MKPKASMVVAPNKNTPSSVTKHKGIHTLSIFLGCSGLITFTFKNVMAMSKSPYDDLLSNHSIQSIDGKSRKTKEE